MSEPSKTIRPAAPPPSPATDPTNRWSQEAAGMFAPNERSNERRQDEPGLTDEDRQVRHPGKGERAKPNSLPEGG
jgi:hypothetical protein